MGNLCTEKIQEGEVYKLGKNQKLKNTMNLKQSGKIAEIKQFLTLSCQNTQSFYNAQLLSKSESRQDKRKINEFKVIRGLGRGAFGQVYMVKDIIYNKFYAMKIINKDRIITQQQKINTLSQRYILEAMNHPFIVKLHYAFQTLHKLYLLVDLMAGGQLFYLLRKNQKFSEEVCKFYLAEILLAIEYLHSRNIIYRDLKPQNILLDKEGHIKITDFGLSKVCYSQNQVTYSVCGTPEYIAPEIIMGKGYNQTADWFSFGSLMYDMMTGKPPFYSKNKHQILKKIATKPVPIPDDLSKEAKSLLHGLLKIKPQERIGSLKGSKQIKQHQFFKDIDFQQIYLQNLKPPIAFKDVQINEEGFDDNIQYWSKHTFGDENTLKQKGFGFDGFTYNKQQILSPENRSKEKKTDNQNIVNFQ